MIGVGAMIGAGIFVLTGMAVGNAGPAALIAFGLNGVITLFTALSYAELSNQHDFLILGMRKGAWLKSFFFGLIAQQITGRVSCPTLLTKTKSTTRLGLKKTMKSPENESCLLE